MSYYSDVKLSIKAKDNKSLLQALDKFENGNFSCFAYCDFSIERHNMKKTTKNIIRHDLGEWNYFLSDLADDRTFLRFSASHPETEFEFLVLGEDEDVKCVRVIAGKMYVADVIVSYKAKEFKPYN